VEHAAVAKRIEEAAMPTNAMTPACRLAVRRT